MFREMILMGLHTLGDSAIDALSDDTGKDKEQIVKDLDLVYKLMAESVKPLLLEQGYTIDGDSEDKLTGSLATALSATHIMAAFTIAQQVMPDESDGEDDLII